MSMTAICKVDHNSPAQRAGIQVGERLVQVNGKPVIDVLDYKFYTYDPQLELLLETETGEQRTVHVTKEEGEDLGLTFETYLMDRARSCANNCIFCFVDQMPKGMRKSLYFKDDDTRLSFLMGNYLTLTNLSQREIQRIIDLRISPINISVHTTDPNLRKEMLKNPRAGEALDIMKRLAKANIRMNCQVVSCPGINDGAALDRTLSDLSQLYPAVESVAIVPVGVTKFRDGLYPIAPYTKEQAGAVIDQVEAFGHKCMEQMGTQLAWCSDEFYLLAGRELPEKAYYEDMNQLENGVGMLRLLLNQAELALEDPIDDVQLRPFSVATGVSAAPFIEQIVRRAMEAYPELKGKVYAIQNHFFGETITVSGLITGTDLVEQLKGQELGERLLIPSNMLRSGERVCLDDMTVEQLEQALGVPVIAVDSESGYELVDTMLGMEPEQGFVCHGMPEEEYYQYNQ